MGSGERRIAERRVKGLGVRVFVYVPRCSVVVPSPINPPACPFHDPLPHICSLVLPTYSPVLDVAIVGFHQDRVGNPEINCRLEVEVGEGLTISVDRVGGRTSGVCHARGEEGREDRKVRILHDCCVIGDGVGGRGELSYELGGNAWYMFRIAHFWSKNTKKISKSHERAES